MGRLRREVLPPRQVPTSLRDLERFVETQQRATLVRTVWILAILGTLLSLMVRYFLEAPL